MNKKRLIFEDCITEIDKEIEKRRSKWTLTAITWMDFDDVAQILRIHLHKKWHMYDQDRPLVMWVNKIITNQIKNLRRNIYDNNSRPCLRCAAAEGNDLCAIYIKQCNDCILFKHWEKKKKSAYDIKLPVSIEDHMTELYNLPSENYNYEKAESKLHEEMKKKLKTQEWKLYELMFVLNLPDDEIAIKMGYKTTESHRKAGYNTINKMRKMFIEKAYKIKEEVDLF